jgi:hypothetical protein
MKQNAYVMHIAIASVLSKGGFEQWESFVSGKEIDEEAALDELANL